MTFEWQDHHFINKVPCLDLVNTIVWRNSPHKTEDRLSTRQQLERWVKACGRLGGADVVWQERQSLRRILLIRNAADRYFRYGEGWRTLVQLYAKALAGNGTELDRLILLGALKLALSGDSDRVKVCDNCGWLFIDRTRNQNKRWCITELCGSRTKARRHYVLKRQRLRQSRESHS